MMRTLRLTLPFLVLFLLPISPASAGGAKPSPQAVEFFETKIRPLFAENCLSCHGPKKQRAGLRLDSRAALLEEGDNGPVVVPGHPEKSLLLRVLSHTLKVKMPPDGKLPQRAIDDLTAWVKMGAPWPDADKFVKHTDPKELWKKHWAFQPVKQYAPPAVKNNGLVKTPVDAFLQASLEAKGLTLSPAADRRTLLRRVTFDLHGLPPTFEEIEAFEKDTAANAFEKVVDRLLASPRYGERWARHWLDVARYADTKGYVFTEERRYAYSYTYRDYVIRAFNEDLPYDQFILQQLAADRLPLGEDKRPLAAMGFLTLGRRFLNNIHDIVDDRIDVTTRGLLGLTVACARCHDHKYDPIPTKDYYSLHGVFLSSNEPKEGPLIGTVERTPAYVAFEKELQAREAKLAVFRQQTQVDTASRLRAKSADCLLAVRNTRLTLDEEALPLLTKGEIPAPLLTRWTNLLQDAGKGHHPILAAWLAFANLPLNDFAKEAPVVAALVATNADAKKRHNGQVAKLFQGKAPATLTEVARRYQQLFTDIEKLASAKTPLADADQEAIRKLLFEPGGPAFVGADDLKKFIDRKARDQIAALTMQVDQWKATSKVAPPRAMVLEDKATPVQARVLNRGNPNNPGPLVPRQFLGVLAGEKRQPFKQGSGRLEMARAIASKDNPLTARVLVNRLWLHHFGAGLVTTPSDFGIRSDPPSHPELLDYLATRFVDEGWSIKKMHRLLLLSHAYQQQSEVIPKAAEVDPENRLLSRMNRRRLDFEAMRDSLLAVSGKLDPAMGGPAVDIVAAPFTGRRSVYGFIERQNLPGLFRTFDFASPDATTAQRFQTTVPQQALFLMNSPFVIEQSRLLATRPELAGDGKAEERIQKIYRRVFGRAADADEVRLGLEFLQAAPKESAPGSGPTLGPWERYTQVLLLSNEFLFID